MIVQLPAAMVDKLAEGKKPSQAYAIIMGLNQVSRVIQCVSAAVMYSHVRVVFNKHGRHSLFLRTLRKNVVLRDFCRTLEFEIDHCEGHRRCPEGDRFTQSQVPVPSNAGGLDVAGDPVRVQAPAELTYLNLGNTVNKNSLKLSRVVRNPNVFRSGYLAAPQGADQPPIRGEVALCAKEGIGPFTTLLLRNFQHGPEMLEAFSKWAKMLKVVEVEFAPGALETIFNQVFEDRGLKRL
ncbi:hypothetical protein N7532_011129 [Penicillium argentinense]|uniref:Uncharacterized protein n=1 Tax=Penicillium argentinense TaxID=1131581 RepID=A0A9W9EHV2_9EURO|nr:uncharacterized protein N7532_011129 [Penicillium argentinense]KAJ5082086.1 hypothetical protein N7532_011129 [Penicillium argentinense]